MVSPPELCGGHCIEYMCPLKSKVNLSFGLTNFGTYDKKKHGPARFKDGVVGCRTRQTLTTCQRVLGTVHALTVACVGVGASTSNAVWGASFTATVC